MTRITPIHHRRSGIAMIYGICIMMAMLAVCSLAVDYGRMRVARTQLQAAADAAAMYGVTGIKTSVATAQSRAIAAAADNKADGSTVTLAASDIQFGTWDPVARNFTVLTGTTAQAGATAMRVTTRATVSTPFAALLGSGSIQIQTSATATIGRAISPAVGAIACPWLAGMPNGSKVTGTGSGNTQNTVAPTSTPLSVSGVDLSAGTKLTFRLASGTTGWDDSADYGPDGDADWIVAQAAANGINTTQAPIGALVGIFLDARAPNTYSQASQLDFTTPASRDFTTLSPALKQVFFIGDGLTSGGQLQSFVVPTGATRLYLGIMDENGWWWDNTGTLTTTMMDDTVALVK